MVSPPTTGGLSNGMLANVTLDEVMKARLITRELIGGRKSPKGSLTKCSFRFRDLCYKLSSSGADKKEIESLVFALKREIKLANLEMRKIELVDLAMDADLDEYLKLQSHFELTKKRNRKEIQDLQQMLVDQKLVRRDKQEYEALATMANTLQSKRNTQMKLSSVQADVDNLKSQEVRRDVELDVREKQFQLLLQCIFDLKSALEEDEDSPQDVGEEIHDAIDTQSQMNPLAKKLKLDS